ncbi:hypothetical protein SAMN04488100_10540 [Alkalibacterium putridalgicola]|uniref:Uncharacterized protein n=1 Tax=Alkalibacterium putridalgicola TaxID=426703 RepID=A0A1H7RLI7_9LACT|nr:hypothetical protein [Alkalibacterium putridalgicola]GEK88899.1 hypothetical protein APU01nite_09380 [Alkalibacterium putridalgicola]SEL61180.1 hypothetical protein SAMN04488100_10540 [Alkalibacterium putridalgicola]
MDTFTNFIKREPYLKSKLKEDVEIDGVTRYKNEHVVYLNAKGEFEGKIIGFYEVSALVMDDKTREITCVNFKNLIDPDTDKRFVVPKAKYGRHGMRLTPLIER